MYKSCTTEETAQRQRQFESCLLEMMKTRRFDDISITQICEKMRVPRGMFYRYFENKDDILFSLIDHTFLAYSGYKPGNTVTIEEISATVSYWKMQKPLLDAIRKSQLHRIFLDRITQFALMEDSELSKRLYATGRFDSMESVIFTINGLACLMLYWHHNGYQKTEEEMVDCIVRLFTKPLMMSNLND